MHLFSIVVPVIAPRSKRHAWVKRTPHALIFVTNSVFFARFFGKQNDKNGYIYGFDEILVDKYEYVNFV